MRAESSEVSWTQARQVAVRIVNEKSDSALLHLPKNADEKAVPQNAETVRDEGYEADPAMVSVRR